MTILEFINSIDSNLYHKIRQSKSDIECRIYLKEHYINTFSSHISGSHR